MLILLYDDYDKIKIIANKINKNINIIN